MAVEAVVRRGDGLVPPLYYDLVVDSLSEAAREAFAMNAKNYEYRTEFARKYFAQGKAEAVLQVLDARGVAVPDAIRERVRACADTATLDRWIRRAALAATAAEVVDGDS
jgi:hypothetical protein